MAKPIVSVVGNIGRYQPVSPLPIPPVLNKVLWSGSAFTAAEQLQGSNMPITQPSNAPYAFSFLNKAASAPQFRVALTDYDPYSVGTPGVSSYWFYDPTGVGWSLKSSYPTPNSLPMNPYTLANIDYRSNPYLVAADYDSTGNNGGTLRLLSMTGADAYAVVTSLAIPNQTVGTDTYQAHVQDIVVDGDRIFVLIIYSNIDTTVPPSLSYISSEVREYRLSGSSPSISFTLWQTVTVSKNAVSLVPGTVSGSKYLFIPCIGGMQNYGSNNGADSTLSLVQINSSNLGAEKTAYIGGAYPDLHDFRAIAIATDGTAYILTGDYDASYNMNWILYQTTAAALVTLANAATTGTIPLALSITSNTHYDAYFWALGICSNGTDEYLVFGKGSNNTSASTISQDEVHLLQVGASWSDTANAVNFILSPDDLNGTSAVAADGFALNSMDVSVPGGTVWLKTAHHHLHAEHVRALRTKAAEEAEKK
jgi:hypothetical protein